MSTIHVKHLVEMAPAGSVGRGVVYGVDTFDVGMSAYGVSTWRPTRRRSSDTEGPRSAVSAGLVGWPEDVLALGRASVTGARSTRGAVAARGHTDARRPGPRARGPPHGQAAQPADMGLPEGVASWRTHKETISDGSSSTCVGSFPGSRTSTSSPTSEEPGGHRGREPAHGPRGIPRRRPQLRVRRRAAARARVGGSTACRSGALPDGRNTHPGGSVTGVPGRNAAMVHAERPRTDLGGGDAPVAGRTRAGSN